jgi:hypothetical protein
MHDFTLLNQDQRRETINTQQRYATWRQEARRARDFRGSMVWSTVKGQDYLIRSLYNSKGERKQKSLGQRNKDTEAIKSSFENGRLDSHERMNGLKTVLARQAAINRALALGRVPQLGASIIRILDDAGLLGNGLRILGTYALYAYEAAAGVFLDPGLTTTEDIDILLDARHGLSFAVSEDVDLIEKSLLKLLQRVDRSFERTNQNFRAANRDGYLVDLIKPMRSPPWTADQGRIGDAVDDLDGAEIEGLVWHESAPAFEAICIDDRGQPLRIITSDPRVWAIHKLWLSERTDRALLKRRRDAEQAKATIELLQKHMLHLPFERAALKMLPKEIVEKAMAL